MENYKYFKNKDCEYYPCHDNLFEKDFNCLFCYCPLYQFKDCGGNYFILPKGTKDCSNCLLPHNINNYEYIINKLKTIYNW